MNIETLEAEIEKLRVEFEQRKRELQIQFAKANNPYKVGDILQDNYKIGRVTSIVTYLSKEPQMIYKVVLLNKDLTEKKKNNIGQIFQQNVKAKLN
ncbi:MAG: hypothetical protein HC836_34615 [Richelia sp. RM2_1_2]|nr:hypothetical protein [Richelia sp. RM2_1_2]